MVVGARNRFVVVVVMAVLPAMLLVACGSPQAPASVILTGEHQPVEVDVAPAKVGNISVTTSYAAIVEATDLVDVVPLATGRVETIAVNVGSEVKQGQVVAELSHGTLDAQLQQAQAELAAAKAAVKPDSLRSQARLDAARAVLNELQNPSSSDLKVAESLVTKAQRNLEKAQTKSVAVTAKSNLDNAKTMLDQLLTPLPFSLQAAKSAAAAAQSNLDSAKTKLSQLLDPPKTALQASEGSLAVAQSKMDSANTRLSLLMNPPAPDLAAAQEAVADARSRLSDAQSELNQAISNQTSASWGLLLGARIALQANRAILDNPSLNVGLTPEEIADAEEAVAANQVQISRLMSDLSSAPLLVRDDKFNTSSLIPKEIRAGLWKEAEAELALKTSLAKLQELQDPSEETVSLVKNDVAIATAGLLSSQAILHDLKNPSERAVALAQDQVAIAQATLDTAQETLNELQNPSQSTISLAQNNVVTAEAALASAAAQARHEIAAAQAALDAASTQLNDLKTPRPSELAAAKAKAVDAEQAFVLTQGENGQHRVQAAQAKVEQAEQQLAETQVLAPFDGVVTRIWLSVGALASPRPMTPIITVASGAALVSLRVEETGVGFFHEGQKVRFTSPGLPGGRLELQVDLVSPTGEQEAHTFLVQMSPSGTVPGLKPGLSGEVSISADREGVLLVPKDAVRRVGGQFSLFVVRDEQARSVEVAVGLVDAKNMEILGGIQPGELVVVSGQNRLSDTTPVTVAN
jgi:RND family efflux transporter MFP subunit